MLHNREGQFTYVFTIIPKALRWETLKECEKKKKNSFLWCSYFSNTGIDPHTLRQAETPNKVEHRGETQVAVYLKDVVG